MTTGLETKTPPRFMTWSIFIDEVVTGEWADTPAYEMLWRIEHAGHSWVTNRHVMLRLDVLTPLDELDDDAKPTLTPWEPTAGNEVLARLTDPFKPSRHADHRTDRALGAVYAGPLLEAGFVLPEGVDARLPQPILLGAECVGLLMPLTPGTPRQGNAVLNELDPLTVALHRQLAQAERGIMCDRDAWALAAIVANSGQFALAGTEASDG